MGRMVEDFLRLFAGIFNSPFPKLEPALEVFQKEYLGNVSEEVKKLFQLGDGVVKTCRETMRQWKEGGEALSAQISSPRAGRLPGFGRLARGEGLENRREKTIHLDYHIPKLDRGTLHKPVEEPFHCKIMKEFTEGPLVTPRTVKKGDRERTSEDSLEGS